MIVYKAHIESYIPQRFPFIMIDNLIEATANKFITDFQVLSDNLFVEEDVLTEYALVENIAQSSAAGMCYMNISSRTQPGVGLIGGIFNLILYDLPRVNDLIYTTVTKLHQFDNIYLLKGESFATSKKLVECELKLILWTPKQPGN